MANALALLQLASFCIAVFVVSVAGLWIGYSEMRNTSTPVALGLLITVLVTIATRSYRLWKWASPGCWIGSLLLLIAHCCLLAGLVLLPMIGKGKDIGLLSIPLFLACVAFYFSGLLGTTTSMFMAKSRQIAMPPTLAKGQTNAHQSNDNA